MKKNLLLAALAAVLVASIGLGQGFPTITFLSPKGGETVKFPVNLSISLSDSNGLKAVEYTIDGTTTISANNWPPYAAVWDANSRPEEKWKDGSYRVDAKIFVGGGYASSAISVTLKNQGTSPPVPLAPPTPKNFAGVALSSSQVLLTWDSSPTAKGYNLKMAVGGRPIPTPRLTTETTYTSSGLSASSDVYCALTAYNDAGESVSTTVTVRTLDLIKPVKTFYIPEDFYSLQDGVNYVAENIGPGYTVVFSVLTHETYSGIVTPAGKPVRIVVIYRHDNERHPRGIVIRSCCGSSAVYLSNPSDVVVMSGFDIRVDWSDSPAVKVTTGASFVLMDSDVHGGYGKLIVAENPQLVHLERVNFYGSMWNRERIWAVVVRNAQAPSSESGVKVFDCAFYDLSAIDARENTYPPLLSKTGKGDSNSYYGVPIKMANPSTR